MPDAPSLLLPHGYPCSSFQYRRLLPALADRYHLIAPDFPGFGFSETPGADSFHFDAYCDFLEKLVDALGLGRFALYLHDYGSQIGLRLAIRRPDRVTALIIQNGDIYEDVLGPKYPPSANIGRIPLRKTKPCSEKRSAKRDFARNSWARSLRPTSSLPNFGNSTGRS